MWKLRLRLKALGLVDEVLRHGLPILILLHILQATHPVQKNPPGLLNLSLLLSGGKKQKQTKKPSILVYKKKSVRSRMSATYFPKPVIPLLFNYLSAVEYVRFLLFNWFKQRNLDGFPSIPVSCDIGFSCHTIVSAPRSSQQLPRLCHPSSSSHSHFFPAVPTWTDVTPERGAVEPRLFGTQHTFINEAAESTETSRTGTCSPSESSGLQLLCLAASFPTRAVVAE